MPAEERVERGRGRPGEEEAAEAEEKPKVQAPFTRVGFLILLIALIVEGVLWFLMLGPSGLAKDLGRETRRSKEALQFPRVELKDLPVTKRTGINESKTLTMGFCFQLGKVLPEEQDIRIPLSKMNEYKKYLEDRCPWIRDIIRREAADADFNEIMTPSWQNNLTILLKREINEKLFAAHGLKKRVAEVYMDPIVSD